MAKFKHLEIPEGVHFDSWLNREPKKWEDYVADEKTSCECICNVESWNDGWDLHSDPKCHISCCKCVFWEGNAKTRVAYWKKCLKKEAQNKK